MVNLSPYIVNGANWGVLVHNDPALVPRGFGLRLFARGNIIGLRSRRQVRDMCDFVLQNLALCGPSRRLRHKVALPAQREELPLGGFLFDAVIGKVVVEVRLEVKVGEEAGGSFGSRREE